MAGKKNSLRKFRAALARARKQERNADLQVELGSPSPPPEPPQPPLPPLLPPRPWLLPALRGLREPATAVSAAFLALITGISGYLIFPSIFRTWYFNSDEYVIVAEIIRFSNLDLHQRFFDMPGTPFILLVALPWTLFARVAVLISGAAGGVIEFTFHHLPWLFELARFTTLFFYLVSLVLFFLLAQRVFNKAGACVAALLLMMGHTYATFSAFVRVESMAMSFFLGAALLTYRALENPDEIQDRSPAWRDPLFLAGTLAGIAAGVRLHSLAASLPLLWLILVTAPATRRQSYPNWVTALMKYLYPATLLGEVVMFFAFRTDLASKPHATVLVAKFVAATVLVPAAGVIMYRYERTRALVLAAAPARFIKLLVGFGIGVFLAIPTLLPQFTYFLSSIEWYSSIYLDYFRSSWSLWKNIQWLLAQYLEAITRDRVMIYLLFLGIVLVLLKRDRKTLPYLISALLFFVSKPLNLRAAPHHIILWMPFFCMIAAYPIALAYSLLRERIRSAVVPAGAVAVVLVALALFLGNGPQEARDLARKDEVRLRSVEMATRWMSGHAVKGDTIATAYYCFNSGTAYGWMQYMGVPVPQSVLGGYDQMAWWGRRNELAGLTGYLCLTNWDEDAIRRGSNPANGPPPDPYHDNAFQEVASFGTKAPKVDVFHFDFRRTTTTLP